MLLYSVINWRTW